MGDIAIRVEDVSKKYTIFHKQSNREDSLISAFAGSLKGLVSAESKQRSYEEFWALKDLNFEIKKGDRVGVIGRNGAGKSTLLKILSRIVKPTTGRIEYDGRMASLLEVGTGFHGDLTGRENIYLNGSILGMNKSEIDRQFDEIVAFSEVERFLDTPVKRYSSGMYVKLAFAVAVHMNPDILILDEVLAVGDAAFQKKCITKMNELSHADGRTVLFVSHNISSIRAICNHALYLESGKLSASGQLDKVILQYQTFVKNNLAKGITVDVIPVSESGEWELNSFADIIIRWEKFRFQPGWHCDIAAYSVDGVKVFALQSHHFTSFSSDNAEANGITFKVKNIGYPNSDLRLDVGIRKHIDEPYSIVIENCATLTPSDKKFYSYSRQDVITVPETICLATTI
jgi:ABC-type polysaccharide/polyol phosphate transport system ATPase subunit